MPGWVPLNLELLRHPYNWMVIALMIAIAALAAQLIFGKSLPTLAPNAGENP